MPATLSDGMSPISATYLAEGVLYEPKFCTNVCIPDQNDTGTTLTGLVSCGFPLTYPDMYDSRLIYTYKNCPVCDLIPKVAEYVQAQLPTELAKQDALSARPLEQMKATLHATHKATNAWLYETYSHTEAVDHISNVLLWRLLYHQAHLAGWFN